ncbi:hypothetical protein [Limosilactobacillus mucosae]|uniref:hypothetical protein n=1 Tax=Limosilactobacillus mucosae TaxID=97478 RepID=UPI0039924DC4
MADENAQNNDGLQSPVDPLAAMDLLNNDNVQVTQQTSGTNDTANADEINELQNLQEQAEEKQEEEAQTSAKSNTASSNTQDPLAAPDEANKRTYPDFLENAERVPYSLQEELTEWRRNLKARLAPENLVNATGMENTVFEYAGHHTNMLKMELNNGAPIYIPQNQAGNNFRHMEAYIGRTLKISVDEFIPVPNATDDEGHQEYIALGSIRQAEFTIAGTLYSQLEQERKNGSTDFVNQKRVGRIVRVLDRPTPGMLFFEYEGMTIAMLANQFYYMSYRRPFNEVAQVGDQIEFKITDIVRTKFEDSPSVKRAKETGLDTPSGLRYMIVATCLPFRENPDERIRRYEEQHTTFLAHIVSVEPVKGILVEAGQGWWIKGIKPTRLNFHPTAADAVEHTPVSGYIESLDYKRHRGRFIITNFPNGTANHKKR